MPAGTVMGHVHLHVGDLDRAAAFYANGLGFDKTTWSYPGALFLGAGGYHHHVGVNTWAGAGAQPAGPDDARLLEWTLALPDAGGRRCDVREPRRSGLRRGAQCRRRVRHTGPMGHGRASAAEKSTNAER